MKITRLFDHVDHDMLEQERQSDSEHFGEKGDATPYGPLDTKVPAHQQQLRREDLEKGNAYFIQHDFRPYVQFVRRESPEVGEPMTVSMGPQHPSTHGVLRVELVLSGEEVEDIRCHIGYMH